MKKIIVFLFASLLVVSMTACGALVDLDTPKSADLKTEYVYYEKSVSNIRNTMEVSPEESDEIFLILLDCGVEDEINYVYVKSADDGTYSAWSAGKEYVVALDGATVSSVYFGKDQLFPENFHHNDLLDFEPLVEDVLNGTGDTVLGQYAYITLTDDQLKEMTAENLKEFADIVVDGSGYNWVSIKTYSGNGICFSGSDVSMAIYGKLDKDGSVVETQGLWVRDSDGNYTYSDD